MKYITMKNKFNIHFSRLYQNLKSSKSEDFNIFLNALAFLLNLMSGLRAFHILEPLIQIRNAFLEVLLNLTLKLRVLCLVL